LKWNFKIVTFLLSRQTLLNNTQERCQ